MHGRIAHLAVAAPVIQAESEAGRGREGGKGHCNINKTSSSRPPAFPSYSPSFLIERG
jgi:hypothetical protein